MYSWYVIADSWSSHCFRYSGLRLINIGHLKASLPLTIAELKTHVHKASQEGVKTLLETWLPACVKIISEKRDEIEECMPEEEV